MFDVEFEMFLEVSLLKLATAFITQAYVFVAAWEPLSIPIYHSWERICHLLIEILFIDKTAIVI